MSSSGGTRDPNVAREPREPGGSRGPGSSPRASVLHAGRRVPPLAVAIVLVAAALVATAWSTRTTVIDAFAAVRDGQAFTIQQTVRADLADLGGRPTADDLAEIVKEHAGEGLRYLALLDGKGRVELAAGTPLVDRPAHMSRTGIQLEQVDGRVRIEVRGQFRRAWGQGRGSIWLAMEIESEQAAALRNAATRTLLIGLLAALMLLGIAGWLVRSELRKRAQERERERERRLASLGEMSAVLAHEIRNPLASLKGNAQLLASMLPAGEKAKAKAERVVDEAVRLETLTKDLLAFVRTGELARTDVSPAQVAREAIGEAAVTLDVTAAPATWSIDAARIREVIVNLVDNALAASGAGEGEGAAATTPRVEVRVATQRGHLLIDVRDHGPGVPAADRDKIFEPFFTGKTRGTGLGLAIARRVVELHGGTIRVDDAPGGGALFRIEIPA